MLDNNSGLMKIWFNAVIDPDSEYAYEDVPNLSNLREEVYKKLVSVNYEFDKTTE